MQNANISPTPLDLRELFQSLESIVAALSGTAGVLEEARGREELLCAVRSHLNHQLTQLREVTRRVERHTRLR